MQHAFNGATPQCSSHEIVGSGQGSNEGHTEFEENVEKGHKKGSTCMHRQHTISPPVMFRLLMLASGTPSHSIVAQE